MPAIQLAQALQVALPARSGLVRPSALYRLSAELAGLLAQGQDRRLAGNVHQGHGAELLVLHASARAPPTTTEEGMDGRRPSRRQGHHAEAEAAGAGHRHVGPAEHADSSRAWRISRAISTIPRNIPVQTATLARKSSSSARTIPRTISAPHSGKPASTSPWCSARPRISSNPTR